jgi:transposase
MFYAGLDLSRKRLDFHLLDAEGATVEVGAAPPDADGLRGLSERVDRHGAPVRAAIESMNGARFVHDQLERAGWQVEIADAQKVKGLAPLACKTDRIDAWVLAELSRRELVPAIWLPDPHVRGERERARWRLHLVRHRSSLKQRDQRLRERAPSARRRPPLRAAPTHLPGIGWVLAYTIAAEIGDIGRSPTPRKLAGYSGLCPRVEPDRVRRGPG